MFRTVCVCEINTLASRRALVFRKLFRLLISRPFTALDFSEREEDCQHRRAAGGTSVVRHLFDGLRPAWRACATDAAQRPQESVRLGFGCIELNTLLGPAQPPGMFWR